MKSEAEQLNQAISLLDLDKQKANTLLRAFVRDYPENWRGFLCLAGSESILQNYQTAADYLHIALYLNANEPIILRNLGYCYRQQGNLSLAYYYYQKAFDLTQWKDAEILVLLVGTLAELGYYQQACTLLEQAQQKLSRHPLIDFYTFLTNTDSVSPAVRSRLNQYAQSDEIINYLVAFSMKHDAYLYRELDNKIALTKLIKTYQKFAKPNTVDNFYPDSFMLPDELQALKNTHQEQDYWIIKHSNLSGGQGLEIINDPNTLQNLPDQPVLAQKYISQPLLIEGRKFNVRAYLVLLSIKPLTPLLWSDALIFIAPNRFTLDQQTLGLPSIHIANLLASGKQIENSQLEILPSHLLSLKTLLSSNYFDSDQALLLKKGLLEMSQYVLEIIKFSGIFEHSMALAKPGSYPPKFIGLDIIFDDQFRPWLLEIERYPGVGGVFPETKRINDSFKRDYFKLITKADFDESLFTPISPS